MAFYPVPSPQRGRVGAPRIFSASSAATAAVTGTATASITEADVVAGGKTIIITLTGDTWIAAGAASFDLQRDEILQGLDSAQSELLGWNNVVRDLEVVTAVVRTSDTVVTITLSASVTYNITAQETITVTVPGTALTGGNPLTATPTFTVDLVTVAYTLAIASGAYALTGSTAGLKSARQIVAGGGTYVLTGTDAGLKSSRKIAIASGAYALTGTDAGIRSARKLLADAGVYSISGTNATLIYSSEGKFILTADGGIYSVSGTAAGIYAARRIAVESGGYVISGVSTDLLFIGAAVGSQWITRHRRRGRRR